MRERTLGYKRWWRNTLTYLIPMPSGDRTTPPCCGGRRKPCSDMPTPCRPRSKSSRPMPFDTKHVVMLPPSPPQRDEPERRIHHVHITLRIEDARRPDVGSRLPTPP